MAESHLSNEEFFSRLATLFSSRNSKEHGSICLTQKRLTFDINSKASTPTKQTDDPLWDLHPENPLPIIVRATNGKSKEHRVSKSVPRAKSGGGKKADQTKKYSDGKGEKKIKLSTIVQAEEIDAFFVRYAEVCKEGMNKLKKRDRKARGGKKKKKRTGGGGGAAAAAAEGEKKG